jgi:hypothetical protein
MDNYQQCILKMEDFKEFTHYGKNMQGIILFNLKFPFIGKVNYIIHSYNTLMCLVNSNEKLYSINPQRYSITTSKQVNYIRKAACAWESKGYERILWH